VATFLDRPDKVRELSQRIVRRPTAQLHIEWTGTYIDNALMAKSDDLNRVCEGWRFLNRTYDGATQNRHKWLFVDDYSKLDGTFHPMPDNDNDPKYQVGWRGQTVGDDNGNIANSTLTVYFEERYFQRVVIAGDNMVGEYPTAFTVELLRDDGDPVATININAPNDYAELDVNACVWAINLSNPYPGITSMRLIITKWSRPNTFVKIIEAYTVIDNIIKAKEILSLSILEETDSSAGTLPVGNISCNEINLTLQNISNRYFPFNYASDVHTHMTRNRKIVPYIGFIDDNGDEYLVPKGLYWTGEWNVSEQDTGASASAQDRMAQFQKLEYVGFRSTGDVIADGYTTDDNSDAEYTYWLDITAHELMSRLLTHVKITYMQDFKFDIDDNLKSVTIPVAFFKSQSYFDIIKSIAQVSMAYAYMDTPTAEEIIEAKQDGNPNLRDILRVRRVSDVFAKENITAKLAITARDYLTRTHPENADELANDVTVFYRNYTIVDDKSTEDGEPIAVNMVDSDSINRLGVARYEYPDNELIQSEQIAKEIAGVIINAFSDTFRTQTLQTFGDPSLSILDVVEVPEFQKFNPRENYVSVLRRGAYTVKRIQTEFDGSLRQNIECRKIAKIVNYDVINETGDAPMIIDEGGNHNKNINETGSALGGGVIYG
jgi:hypothetical protein